MSLVETDDPMFVEMGNQAHYTSIASILFFAWAVIVETSNENDDDDLIFDKQWRRDGFCVTNSNVAYFSSHDACFYLDTLAAIFIGYLVLKSPLGKNPNMKLANQLLMPIVLGILGHGVAHGMIALAMRQENLGSSLSDVNEKSDAQPNNEGVAVQYMLAEMTPQVLFATQVVSLAFFWITLIKLTAANIPFLQTLVMAFVAGTVQSNLVPTQLSSTFVQTTLMLIFSINQLARNEEEKDFTYATFPLIVTIPLTFVGWLESTQCAVFVRDKFYGHLIYDGFISFSLLTWYVLCYIQVTQSEDDRTTNPDTTTKDANKKKIA
mmetsp:Transcript_1603/g.2284  ORF Transcript_1603/g.2284 Transcript_1603/m.2284 type:complete len:322 (+) Transcript_1603:145-1110(+)|eukprot:CAMPEP_0198143794 /NCGR_PEP_ID=MMETSP1443-20131203/10408_1 /TAXON_ID=186043 /ORGANISM="Entomoneis sp., Strain CCMP2396" /LENGTH=321 /DNA_ID=CAMNT_0043807081 /DNA_START=105 /DNA_END=1070 /DNA_ORIENTATION=-